MNLSILFWHHVSYQKNWETTRHRFGISAPKKHQQEEDGSRPYIYCYIGIRLKKKFETDKNQEIG